MLCKAKSERFNEAGWVYERKWDGLRCIVEIDVHFEDTLLFLFSRTGKSLTEKFPEIWDDLKRQNLSMVLDGEIIVFDNQKPPRPNFSRLAQRSHLKGLEDIHLRSLALPATFMAFDILEIDGRSTMELPFSSRRELLEKAVQQGDHLQVPDYWATSDLLWLEAVTQGLEGIVAKRWDSIYAPGKRSKDWLKIKATKTDEFVVGGITLGEGNRNGMIGSLLLGVYDDSGVFHYVGKVGTGFTHEMLEYVQEQLPKPWLNHNPFQENYDETIKNDSAGWA